MHKSQHLLLLITILIISFSTPLLSQNFDKKDWKLKTSKGDLKVFTRISDDSNFKEIRIQTTVQTSKEKVMEVLNDVSNYTSWVYKCLDAKSVKKVSSNEFYYYAKSDFPFPVSDRDIVIHSRQWTDKNGNIMTHSTASPIMIKEERGVVRIKSFDSYWKIMPQNDGSIKIDYTAMTHPGGSLPAWIVNLAVTKGPMETMKRFTNLVESTQ